MRKMDQITDFSYSWETIDDYIVYLHRIIEQVCAQTLPPTGNTKHTKPLYHLHAPLATHPRLVDAALESRSYLDNSVQT